MSNKVGILIICRRRANVFTLQKISTLVCKQIQHIINEHNGPPKKCKPFHGHIFALVAKISLEGGFKAGRVTGGSYYMRVEYMTVHISVLLPY